MSFLAAVVQSAIRLAKPAEGWRAAPYLCPAGVWTQGYGSTKGVKPTNKPWSREHGEAVLAEEMQAFAGAVLALSPNLKAEPVDVAGALADFAFNLGTTAYKGSTLRRKVRDGEWDEVDEQLDKWVFGGGRRLNGLVKRRRAEGDQVNAAMAAKDQPAAAAPEADRDALRRELRELIETSDDPVRDLLKLLEAR